jgi:hypothetical protein
MLARLAIDADEGYLLDCASVVFPTARQTQGSFDWPSGLRARIGRELQGLDHLSRFADGA